MGREKPFSSSGGSKGSAPQGDRAPRTAVAVELATPRPLRNPRRAMEPRRLLSLLAAWSLLKHCSCDPARALPSGRSSSRFTQSLSFIRSPESAASAALYPLFNCNAHSSTRPPATSRPLGLNAQAPDPPLRGDTREERGWIEVELIQGS